MNLSNTRRKVAMVITNPVVGILSKSGITPDALTFVSIALSAIAACVIATGHFLCGGILVLVSGLCDLFDGALARFTKQTTKFGAILDSVADRTSEAAILFGLLIWFLGQQAGLQIAPLLLFAVLTGSFLVSYIRARAEGLGWQCQVGLFTRAERVIVLAIGLLVNQILIALCLLVTFIFITVVQRLVYLRKQAKIGGE